jgi:uncharacterized protein (UPF0276 family)
MIHRELPRGHGFGVRVRHYPVFLEEGAQGVDFVEVVTENFITRGGRPRAVLDRLRQDVPVVLHGVSLSVGAVSPLDESYLRDLRDLSVRIEPAIVSDHLCFGTWGRHHGHDLWPLPFTEEALDHVVGRVTQVQDVLGRQIALENVSSYLSYATSVIDEWTFLNEISGRADCKILLDINNAYVNAHNFGFAAERYMDGIDAGRVVQLHLAGHLDKGTYLLDDHGCAVPPDVWDLYQRGVARFGPRPTIIEWDENVPPLEILRAEVEKARLLEARTLATSHDRAETLA